MLERHFEQRDLKMEAFRKNMGLSAVLFSETSEKC